MSSSMAMELLTGDRDVREQDKDSGSGGQTCGTAGWRAAGEDG